MVGRPAAAGGGLILGDRQAQGACWDSNVLPLDLRRVHHPFRISSFLSSPIYGRGAVSIVYRTGIRELSRVERLLNSRSD
jgi:hypothetical protein